jgi:hypothetical protein
MAWCMAMHDNELHRLASERPVRRIPLSSLGQADTSLASGPAALYDEGSASSATYRLLRKWRNGRRTSLRGPKWPFRPIY